MQTLETNIVDYVVIFGTCLPLPNLPKIPVLGSTLGLVQREQARAVSRLNYVT